MTPPADTPVTTPTDREQEAADVLLSVAPDEPEVLVPDGTPRVGRPIRRASLAADQPPPAPRRRRPPPPPRRSGRRTLVVVGIILLAVGGLGVGGVLWGMAQFDRWVTQNTLVARLQPGEHPIGRTIHTPEWGELTSAGGPVPSATVRGTPGGDENLLLKATDFSPGVRITRSRPVDGRVESRTLEAANDDWVEVAVGGDGQVWIQVKDDGGMEAKEKYRYTLIVPPGLTLVSTSPVAHGGTEKRLRDRTGVVEAADTMDQFAGKLRKAFGPDSGITRGFAEKQAKVEADFYTGTADPRPAAKVCIDEYTAWLDWKSPDETLYWLSVVHGRGLTPTQIAAARELFTFPVAGSYAEAATLAGRNRAAAHDPLVMVALGITAPGRPDDFEGIIGMLLWVTEDCIGPKVTLISSRTWTVGLTTYTEQKFRYEWRMTRRRNLEQFVLNAYAGLKVNANARPAADRLMESVVGACRADGPMTAWPENVHNLKLAIDMRTHPNGERAEWEAKTGPFTAAGFRRDHRWYWKQALDRSPEMFSTANRDRIANGRSPLVDDTWEKFNPQDAAYNVKRVSDPRRARLDHHHLAQGPIAVPMPHGRHQDQHGVLHPDDEF